MSDVFRTLDELLDSYTLPLGDWVKAFVDWGNVSLVWLWTAIRWPIEQTLDGVEGLLQALPWYVVVLIIGLISWRLQGWRKAVVFMALMVVLGFLSVDIWRFAMTTLGMIVTAVIICAIIGIPLGIWAASNNKVEATIRPVLDAMQTIHPFIYLIPVVFFFGIGKVPGTIATVVFALPPIVRLTNLGIRQVPEETVEAARAFGSTDRQTLWEVQLPLARPAIMAGLNQTLMLALSMVVIVAIIAGGGLGQQIFRAVGRVDVPLATNSGLAVLILAIILDRLSQTQRARGLE
ncbi:MAG TPA: proline/glycine betaine ABC transporter permease [Acidimicrobiia bacterium]|jgi:glycine betaine/proline transport system permease protein|nr:proline/glycine betaine ABC transporter permease [Acidimicrobiia bacterium]